MDNTQQVWASVMGWLGSHWLMIAAILVGAYIIRKISGVLVANAVRRAVIRGHASQEAETKREETLIRIISGTIGVLVTIVAVMMVLSEAGVDIGPLLAAAGVAGLAFGFGGQYLIRDIIAGLFMILENQYRVGDVVAFDGTAGLVEDISLRMTTLRDLDGTVHHVPHGEIKRVANMTKVYSRVNLDVRVSYDSDLDQVRAVINRVGQELAEDSAWKDAIVSAPQFLRVNEFTDSAIVIKILGDTKPIRQWEVMGELRLRLKTAFDKEGIMIPFPQRTVHMAGQTRD